VKGLLQVVDEGDVTTESSQKIIMPTGSVLLSDIFRANLVIPLGLTTVLCLIGWFIAIDPQFSPKSTGNSGPDDSTAMVFGDTPQNFAFLGAYFFGLQMLFRRFVHRDLGPNAFLAFASRIILAMIAVAVVTYAVPREMTSETIAGGIAWKDVLLVVAFTVGFFPQLVWKYIRALFVAISFAKLFAPNFRPKQPLHLLDGLTVWQEVRLEEEDVENVPNMASVDIVDLMLRTRIPSERMIFWIDQAILLSVLGAGQSYAPEDAAPGARLRDLGIKTATQFHDATGEGQPQRDLIAARLGSEEGKVSALRRAMELEPNFRLMRNWRGI